MKDPRWLPPLLANRSLKAEVLIAVTVGLAVRLYLSFTSYCIAGDGIAYLGMARDYASGHPGKALGSVFSPLYPWIISIAHVLIPNWEMAGNLVSTILGTAAVATVYYLVREAFGRRDYAFGAAIITAIHPQLTAYSASVRTESGYILLMTGAACLLLMALKRNRVWIAAAAGLVAGLAYLYRTEGIGLLIFGVGFILAGALIWRQWSFGWALGAAAAFAAGFIIVGAPYIAYMRVTTGHWSVGREFTAAMMYGMGDVARHGRKWRHLGYSTSVSPFTPLLVHPKLYFENAAGNFFGSFYYYIQAMGPLLSLLMVIGLWHRGRAILENFGEAMLLLLTGFYFCGFALSYTGVRFMVHLIAYGFGWVIAGLDAASVALARLANSGGWRVPQCALAVVVVIALMPQTLWPIGYDMRGYRYAGEEIARRVDGPHGVVARDARVAFYAKSKFIFLPAGQIPHLCDWLQKRPDAGYMVIGNREAKRLGVTDGTKCLQLLKRYPRYGTGYYDLFAIRYPQQ